MTDRPDDAETPIQRALRLKKAALDAKPKAQGADRVRPERGPAAGASRPWLKK